MTERVKCAVNTIDVHDEFCTCYTDTSVVTQLRYYTSDLSTSASKLLMTSAVNINHIDIVRFAIINFFRCRIGQKRAIDSMGTPTTNPTSYEQTCQLAILVYNLEFIYKYFVIQNIKIPGKSRF